MIKNSCWNIDQWCCCWCWCCCLQCSLNYTVNFVSQINYLAEKIDSREPCSMVNEQKFSSHLTSLHHFRVFQLDACIKAHLCISICVHACLSVCSSVCGTSIARNGNFHSFTQIVVHSLKHIRYFSVKFAHTLKSNCFVLFWFNFFYVIARVSEQHRSKKKAPRRLH